MLIEAECAEQPVVVDVKQRVWCDLAVCVCVCVCFGWGELVNWMNFSQF